MKNSSLKVWRDGVGRSGQMPELDIVAVHGLNPTFRSDHAERTWTCEDGTSWLTHKNFLPKKLPQARILRYRYNSAIFCVGVSIFDQAKDLVQRLHRKRSGVHGDPQRPLLFIAHSLGGLLVKAALVAAVIAEGDIYRDLATCPKGLATFGTPHKGAMFASLVGFIEDFIKAMEKIDVVMGDQPKPPEGYRDILRKGDVASYIIGVQFFDCYRSAIPITSFYEMKGFIGRFFKVVEKDSATLRDDGQESNHRERRVGLNAEHASMVKFSRADRGIGRHVLIEIKRLADRVLRSGSSRGLAFESTDTGRDSGSSGPSESTAVSWEEGSVTYSGDADDEFVGSHDDNDEFVDSHDDDVDTEMLEDESIDESKVGSTFSPRRGTGSSSGPKVRQRDPFNTRAKRESATRPNTQWGPHTSSSPPFCCIDCAFSETRQCPSHCKDCQKKRSYRPPEPSYPSNNKYRQPSNSLLYRDEAELCQQHKKPWSKPRTQPGPQGFILFGKQPLSNPVHSSASPQNISPMPAANARPAFVNPQSSSQYSSRIRSPTPPSASRHSQMKEKEERRRGQIKEKEESARRQMEEEEEERRSGRKRKLRKMHQDHSEPSDSHTPQRESGMPAQGSRKSQRFNKDRRDLSPERRPPMTFKATTSTKNSAKVSGDTPISKDLPSRMKRGNGRQPPGGKFGPGPRRGTPR